MDKVNFVQKTQMILDSGSILRQCLFNLFQCFGKHDWQARLLHLKWTMVLQPQWFESQLRDCTHLHA